MNDRPEPAPVLPLPMLFAALSGSDLALALADARGILLWCSDPFAALFTPPAAPGQALATRLGNAAAARLAQHGEAAIDAGGAPWRLRSSAGGNGTQVLHAEAAAELHTLQAQVSRLQERLDLVQHFGRTGVFERDPATMQGRWDSHMYRIWGLPEPAPGSPSPSHADTAHMMFSEDRRLGTFAATMGSPGPHSQRMRIRRPDGQLRHIHTQWKVFHDAQGSAQRILGVNTDDTEVYDLAARAERLRTELDVALELGRISVWRHDLGSDRLVLDERGCQVIGVPFSEDGVTLAQARARIHPEDVAQAEASAALTLRSGEPSDMELRYPREGGGWKRVLLRRALLRSPDGRLLGYIGVLMDVTERVEASRRALESARRLEAAAEAARIGLWATEVDKPLPSWNRRMFELSGLDPQAGPLPLGDWLQRCVHADDRQRVEAGVVAWWRAGQGALELEFRIVRPADGALRWLVVRGLVDQPGGGAARRAEGVAIDVTEQQHTLRQLHETVGRLTLTASALGLGTWEADHPENEIRWDTQMFRLRGVASPARPVTLAEIASYLHPDDRTQVMAELGGHVRAGEGWQREFRVVRSDGQVRWITSQSVLVADESGRQRRRIGVNWDITETRSATQALRERELAVAESQAKSQAMSRISHELRTPLNAVLGFTQLLRGAPADADTEKRARWLAHVDDAGHHLLALIDDVLELSRAEVGELRLAQQPVAWSAFVDATLPLLAGAAQASKVRVLRAALPGVVLADPVRLRQVLINLVSNGIKYNQPGGQVRLSSEVRGGMVALRVADTGIGIAPDRLQHAFEPFNRLGAEATGVEGSGIGLAIVKVLVEHMGGRVEVQSRLGEGTEFVVWLPAAAAGPPAVPAAAPARVAATPVPGAAATAPDAPARVLYIEDNAVNALLVREVLAGRPAVVLDVAEDGRSGVRSAAQTLPDLILVDMQLPDIDGLAVLRALREDPRTAAIRCVALSANATPEDVEAALAAGFLDYWTKPIDFTRFLDSLGTLLGRRL
jgi:signal transduction histidine kinase